MKLQSIVCISVLLLCTACNKSKSEELKPAAPMPTIEEKETPINDSLEEGLELNSNNVFDENILNDNFDDEFFNDDIFLDSEDDFFEDLDDFENELGDI